jgi:hypothetical protein
LTSSIIASSKLLHDTTQLKRKKQGHTTLYAPYLDPGLTRDSWHSHPSALPSSLFDFMQPEPTELPQESHNSPNPSNLVNSSQYGLPTNQLPAAELRGSPLEGYAAPGCLFAAGSPSEVALHDQLSGLSLDDNSRARSKPSFQRISEYENALSPSPPR